MSKALVLFLTFLVVCSIGLHFSRTEVYCAAEEAGNGDIVVAGKLYCVLKRKALIPYHGFIISSNVSVGQKVEEGQPLVKYRLGPEVTLELRRRVSPYKLKGLELQLAEVEKNMQSLYKQRKQTRQLAQSSLAPAQSINQIEADIQVLGRKKTLMQGQVRLENELLKEDLALLSEQLGQEVGPDQLSEEAVITAPITGHVIDVNPFLREGVEFKAGTPVLEIGHMNTMMLMAFVHEIEAVKLNVGDQARVVMESIPQKKFEATISRIYWTPSDLRLGQPSYYRVIFDVPNPDFILKEGFTGKIYLSTAK